MQIGNEKACSFFGSDYGLYLGMDDSFIVYEVFNQIEGLLWFGVAIALPFLIPRTTRRQRLSVFAAMVGFILFGTTDWLDAPTHGQMPLWLWAYKIGCAAFLLSCRFFYIGWDHFRWSDRYFRFGVFCLTASLGVIWLQHVLYGD